MDKNLVKNPKVSVLLPVYNGATYLAEAIDSILNQTMRDFELIIINDGSTDNSSDIIRGYTDSRIRFLEQENRGLAVTLNQAVTLSKGLYLARQDQDDVSYPERFERQVAFLDVHPSCGMVGTWAEIWLEQEKTKRSHRHPAENALLKLELLFNNPFVHSSVMFRSEVFAEVGLYSTDKSRQPPEDYEMWSRIAKKFDIANIPEILHVYRETGGSMSRENWLRIMDMVVSLSAENIAHAAGLPSPETTTISLAALANGVFQKVSGRPNMVDMKRIFFSAAASIRKSCHGDGLLFEKAIKIRWRNVRYNHFQCVVRPIFCNLLGRFRIFQ